MFRGEETVVGRFLKMMDTLPAQQKSIGLIDKVKFVKPETVSWKDSRLMWSQGFR
jgi:hypothetical protein